MAGCDGIPVRSLMIVMIFFGAWNSYLLRVDLSFDVVDMVPVEAPVLAVDAECAEESGNASQRLIGLAADYYDATDTGRNASNATQQRELKEGPRDSGPRLPWSRMDCAHLLAAFFYGQTVAHVSGPHVARRLGPKRAIGWGMLLAAAANLVFPFAAVRSHIAAMLARFATGLFAGAILPAMLLCVERWTPRKETAVYMWHALGGGTGVALAWPLCATLTLLLGWPWCFFAASGVAMVWGVLWLALGSEGGAGDAGGADEEAVAPGSDASSAHRDAAAAAAAAAELQEPEGRARSRDVPWTRIYSSPPVQALICLQCSHAWAEHFLLLYGPYFYRQVLGFSPLSTSLVLVVTVCGRTAMGLVAAGAVRLVVRRHRCYALAARKCIVLVSHAAPAAILLWALVHICGARDMTAVLCATALALSGAGGEAPVALAARLTRSYRAQLIMLLNVAGSLIGVSVPLFVGSLTSEENSASGWRGAVGGVAAALAIGCFMFLALGSVRQQSWDRGTRARSLFPLASLRATAPPQRPKETRRQHTTSAPAPPAAAQGHEAMQSPSRGDNHTTTATLPPQGLYTPE